MGKNKKYTQPIAKTEVKEETPIIKEEVKEEIKEVEAIVDGVNMSLNIRMKPEVKEGNQVTMVTKGTKIVVVDPKHPISNGGEDWYKVKVQPGNTPGYAMKKYIKIL